MCLKLKGDWVHFCIFQQNRFSVLHPVISFFGLIVHLSVFKVPSCPIFSGMSHFSFLHLTQVLIQVKVNLFLVSPVLILTENNQLSWCEGISLPLLLWKKNPKILPQVDLNWCLQHMQQVSLEKKNVKLKNTFLLMFLTGNHFWPELLIRYILYPPLSGHIFNLPIKKWESIISIKTKCNMNKWQSQNIVKMRL